METNAFIVTDKRNENVIAIFSDQDHAKDYGKKLIGEFAVITPIFNPLFIKK